MLKNFFHVITLLGLLLSSTSCSPAGSATENAAPAATPPLPVSTEGVSLVEPLPITPIEEQEVISLQPADINILLGRPTANSITANVYSKFDTQIRIVYGTASGIYSFQTPLVDLKANTPQNIEIEGLSPNTEYFYRLISSDNPLGEHAFQTQRPTGSTFTFTLDADPHNGEPNFNGELYSKTLSLALNDRPDFHIDLGDTFMTEKLKPQSFSQAEETFTAIRPYFSVLGAEVPLFLVNGNHEGEMGWLFKSGNTAELPLWSTELRHTYYPNPIINDFYNGSKLTDPALGAVRDGYYSWTWGEALFIVLDPFWNTTEKPKPDEADSNWNWTLGKEQYDWLRTTLETSPSKYKFIMTHHLVGGDQDARGGIEFANLYEWGGNNADGSYGFDLQRPDWGKPIHQLLVDNKVSAVFHGHDHVFVKQILDGVIYQEVPQPNVTSDTLRLAEKYGCLNGDVIGGSGYLRVMVSPIEVIVDFVRVSLSEPEQVAFSYSIQ
ncbi:MAG: metallophosphoesterase [Chloroflexi bacterium]|nr:metallophosphoesterase [Chloroflexota bacterium]